MASTPIHATRPRAGYLTPGNSSTGVVKSILRSGSTPTSAARLAASTTNSRKRSRDDGDDSSSSSEDTRNPMKRRKTVHFDMDLNVTAEVGSRSLEDTKKSVRKALEAHALGDDQDYDELRDIFGQDKERSQGPLTGEEDDFLKPEELVVYVVALTTFAPLLNRSCFTLVKKILECSWLGRDETFFRAYVQFLAALISAQGGCLRPVLEMIVDKFKESRPSSWNIPELSDVDRATMQTRLHLGLRYILELFPPAKPLICKLVAQKFPYTDEPKSAHMFYIDNLLRLRDYAPDLKLDIMELIVHQTVKLDSEFFLDLSDLEDDLVTRVVFQLGASASGQDAADDAESDAGSDDDLDSEDPDYDEEANRVEKITSLVRKLDATLDTLFGVFTPIFANPDSDEARSCLEDMLSDFTNLILPVKSSRHTQFLIFHFSQKSPALQDIFTGTLLNLAFGLNRPTAIRQAAVWYISGYLSRGARVPAETVRSVISILCARIESYRRSNAATCRGPDLQRYPELYSWVQAVLYIFCFRWKDLVDSYPDIVDPEDPSSYLGHDLDWMPGLKESLKNIIHSQFNPLLVCAAPIVSEFAKLARSLHFDYFDSKINANSRVHLSQFASAGFASGEVLRDPGYDRQDEGWLQLESVWPFDPFWLPVSKRWLEGDYVSWVPIPGLHGAEGDEEDSDEEVEAGGDELFEEDTATGDGGD